jgi:hypothetical protein
MYEAVSHMAERLSAYKETEQGVENPFRDYFESLTITR